MSDLVKTFEICQVSYDSEKTRERNIFEKKSGETLENTGNSLNISLHSGKTQGIYCNQLSDIFICSDI